MILFDVKKLEQKLKTKNISDKEILNYLLATLLLDSFISKNSISNNDPKWVIFFKTAIGVIVTVIAVNRTYKLNSTSDIKDYLIRFISLSVVISFRILLFATIMTIPFAFSISFITEEIDSNKMIKQTLC
jgi:uncharacterized membrane protein